MDYFREVANSAKFQISAAISFGTALVLIWLDDNDPVKITLTVLFLFAACMFIVSLIEKIGYGIYKRIKKNRDWNNLTPEETEFIKHYIQSDTKTRYQVAYNGTWQDSGVITLLKQKRIIYLASTTSEFRGESWMSAEQTFPFNIHDDAFKFFKKKFKEDND